MRVVRGVDSPPVPAGALSTRSSVMTVRLTTDEAVELRGAAVAAGRGQLGRWMRETLLAAARGKVVVERKRAGGDLGVYAREVHRVGLNLNQLVTGVHTANKAGAALDWGRVLAEISRVAAGLEQVVAVIEGGGEPEVTTSGPLSREEASAARQKRFGPVGSA